MAPLGGELLLFHHREQELLVFLGVHIFPGNEYASDLHKILRRLPLRDAHGLLHGSILIIILIQSVFTPLLR